ncbi:hypothetical protein [Symbioplanes lichenis]|uniref:hypothetical protein n=1 Tax=Symbioplanes lichenis TaxID=1629072 RepID=UPI002739CB8B|nr:hypothetical protein [Actinoplanes lichenis]
MTGIQGTPVVMYDAGALIAAESAGHRIWAAHRKAIREGRKPLVPSVVLAQTWRDPRKQVLLSRFLQGCEDIDVGEVAKAAGELCGQAGTSDVVDAMVVSLALLRGAVVYTSDPDDIRHLAEAAGPKTSVLIRRV